ncbi:EmrB/QacA subfamily drug resistance transporter [Nocardioides thalensis]|uniref:EmrB/QacA subfamily drug resistance transporter n=1 Tax=Nocardioides thalensis TaxID=1914755 RepID=A0A853C596_9ACTN|nr:DHA2 family efflux MFS transporter permease subunit [Nocardioides thalensis]NYJ02945.1 EmrB/QacA subfamily drug resistance transporter [Nocardioides thalensis]
MTSDALEPAAPVARPVLDPRRWKALALLCVAFFMVIVDSQIVILALPEMRSDLGMSATESTWVMSAYMLSFGGLLLLGGRTADHLGGRRMFMVGTALFMAASVACALAPTGAALIAARLVQGAAAAIMTPTAMTVLMATFPEGAERNKALGIWTGIGAFGATAALLIGGPITDGLGWPWVFYINVPLGLIVLVLGPKVLRETARVVGRSRFDAPGAALVTGAVGALVYAIIEAPSAGWASGQTLALLVGAAILMVGFVLVEQRSPAPLVPLRIFRSATFVSGNVIVLLVGMAVYGGAMTLSLYAQDVLGYSAVAFGLSTAIYAAMSLIGSNVAGRLITTAGFRRIALVGSTLMGTGLVVLAFVSPDGNYWDDLFIGLVVFGSGIGTTHVAGSVAALSGAKPEEAGLASGVTNAVFQVGAALGIAITSTVALATKGAGESAGALTEGYRASFWTCAVFVLVAFVIALATRRTPRDEREGASAGTSAS